MSAYGLAPDFSNNRVFVSCERVLPELCARKAAPPSVLSYRTMAPCQIRGA